ncbi:MAG: DUF3553 domain-containing protein, partial [Tepidisphaeraceae bacterium]
DLYAVSNGMTLWGAMEQAHLVPGLSTRAIKSTQAFVQMMNGFRTTAGQSAVQSDDIFAQAYGTVQSIMEQVVQKSGLLASLEKSTDPDKPELANVKELINSGAAYDAENPEGTLDDYLAQVSLMSDADKIKGAGGAVTLMTLHAAKGLEFPIVAMIGLEEGVLPHSRARTSPDDLEEERRLCFVGITRAQQQIFLSRAYARTMMGRRERTVQSPFIKEMPQDYIETIDHTATNYDAYGDSHFEADVRRGQMVRHPMFGMGQVAEVMDAGVRTRVIVDFARVGRKTLILEQANLQVLG